MRMNPLLLPVLSLVVSGCPDPGDEARKPVRGAAASRNPPGTAPPAGGAPERGASRYNPARDPENSGGWRFDRKRSPADPADARKKPLTIEALYRIMRISDPQWAPDGARILFTVTRHDLKAGKSDSDIYRIDADGSGLRRMTWNKGADHHPRWAPNGESFLFVSDRKDDAQIWRMPVDGGEARRLTGLSTGVESPRWSPDGKLIAFTSRVFPEYGADDAKNKKLLDTIKDSPVKAYMADDLLYRHWTSFKDGRRSHVLVLDVESEKITDVTPGDFEAPAFGQGSAGFDFSPDSSEICFVSNRGSRNARAWTTNKDLLVVPAKGGRAVNLTAANKASDGHATFGPRGRYIAFIRQQAPGHESAMMRLALYDRKRGKIRILTAGFDYWVIDHRWAADGRSIVFKAAVKGRFPLFRIDVETGKLSRLALPSARDFDVSSEGRLVFSFHSVGRPLELFTADSAGGGVSRVTFFNRDVVEAYDLRPVEEQWIEGAGGKKVHTFIVKPHGFQPGKRYPLIVNVHGGPQYQWADAFRGDWQIYPAAGYVVAFPNPHGSIGYGQAYTSAISRDWGGKVYQDVMKVTEAMARQPYVDGDRIGAMGWSYGGYMMNWILGHTRRFKALVSMMSLYDLPSFYGSTEELWFPEWDLGGTSWSAPAAYRKWSPSTYAARFKTPTLVISGMLDFRVPYTQSLQLFTALRRQGVPARLILLQKDGHWPSWVKSMPLYYAAHLDWFHRHLGGGPSPYDIREMVRGRAFAR